MATRPRVLRHTGPLLALLATIALTLPSPSRAQAPASDAWPSKPLRIVVGSGPGSSPDIIARLLAQKLGDDLKQPVVVDNRPGAFGNIGMELVARAPADGHTMLVGIPTVVINSHLYPLNFNPVTDLVPVAQLTSVTFVLIARPGFEPESVPAIVEAARKRAGAVSCAWTGPIPHFACELLRLRSGADINVVPYKTQPAAINDLIGGQVDLMFDVTNSAAPQVRAGRVRAIATVNPARGVGPFGALPTMAETFAGFSFVTWQGVFLPGRTTRAIVDRLNQAVNAALDDPDIARKLRDGGLAIAQGSVDSFAAIVRRDHDTYGRIIREAGIKAD